MSDAGVAQPTWLSEYDALLHKIASEDVIDSNWNELRDIIKRKIEKNILLFLTTTQKPPLPAAYLPITTVTGGLKLPPFLPQKIHNDAPISYMNEREASAMKEAIFEQLDQFEDNPPFTIQRLCELCVDPTKHYKSVGKYLRAVEKSTLVTSTWDSFPPLTEGEIHSAGRGTIVLGSIIQSEPSTPLFSPIPFLHDDARRSLSRSPPPTPLNLSATGEHNGDVPALGLVDELDDPSPGHMSDHPIALSSVTTIGGTPRSRPFIDSLEQRFVRSQDRMDDEHSKVSDDMDMDMDMDEDKENTKA